MLLDGTKPYGGIAYEAPYQPHSLPPQACLGRRAGADAKHSVASAAWQAQPGGLLA
jgi:hypothetical protein